MVVGYRGRLRSDWARLRSSRSTRGVSSPTCGHSTGGGSWADGGVPPASAAGHCARARAFSRANWKPGGRSSPSTVTGRRRKLVVGTRRMGLPSSKVARTSRARPNESGQTLRPSMTAKTCSAWEFQPSVPSRAGTWSGSTCTAKPVPRDSSVSADARPNWIVTIAPAMSLAPAYAASRMWQSSSVIAMPRLGSSTWRRKLEGCSRTQFHSASPAELAISTGSRPSASLLSLTRL